MRPIFADQYNPYLGFSGDCWPCPEPRIGPSGYTSYAAAQQCDVERVDLACDSLECEWLWPQPVQHWPACTGRLCAPAVLHLPRLTLPSFTSFLPVLCRPQQRQVLGL